MIKYKRDYMKHYGITEADVLICCCGRVAVDLHHRISKGQGGNDHPTNLQPICRECHNKIHNG
jgi:5-methylcytosine-specific restriction endonuclease McrA